jgi:hypothetical protein
LAPCPPTSSPRGIARQYGSVLENRKKEKEKKGGHREKKKKKKEKLKSKKV